MIHDTQSAQTPLKQGERNIYVIMKTMCPRGYHHNGSVAIYIYIYIYAYMYIYIYIYILYAINTINNASIAVV